MAARVVSITRGRFFYGWLIVAVGFITQFMISGIQGYAFGAFLKPMSMELGWSRATISGVQSFGTLVSGLISPFVGPVIDKRGGRDLMIVGAIICGAGFAALSLVDSVWSLYLVRGVLITIGFTLTGLLTVSVAISNWFIRKRGKAIAFGAMGISLGGMLMTPLAAYLIEQLGWRTVWLILGAAVWLVVIPPVALFMKRRPEDMGLLPDGDSLPPSDKSDALKGSAMRAAPSEEVWTRREAMRTPTLWLIIFAFGFSSMGVGASLLHLIPYYTDLGLSGTAAAGAMSVQATLTFLSKPLWGVLIDRYGVRRVAVAAFVLCSLGITSVNLLPSSPTFLQVYGTAMFYGFSLGGYMPIQEVLWANYFGRLSLGAVRSIAQPFGIIFSSGGPLFAGWAFDFFQNYRFAFSVFTVTFAVAAVLIFLAQPPKKASLPVT